MTACRLIVDSPAEGAWNMALDEALLLSAEREGIAWLRFYAWSEPTLSLGYFQQHTQRQLHPPSVHCKLIRRASGGGAILHDRELTYSIALPPRHPLAKRAELLYDAAHRSLIEVLGEWGIHAALQAGERSRDPGVEPFRRKLSSESASSISSGDERRLQQPFLCFQRRSPGDVLLGAHKIAGSAQRRFRGAVLQHGSLLLAKSTLAPELPGLFDLAKNTAQKKDDIRSGWQRKLSIRLGVELNEMLVPSELSVAASKVFAEKFGSNGWTMRR
ncbi:MAG: hypothetical protein IT427_09495 [Pirellulales bacterium]|nr:hypothetical protein [Pirellulales bacterium]